MKKVSMFIWAAALSVAVFSSCNKDENTNSGGDDDGYGDVSAIVNDYVDKTVLPTYEDMKNKAWALFDAVAALEEGDGITEAKIKAACDAWRATRIPWEQSESFLFGPADRQGLDPLLDSWPLDQSQIDIKLNSNGPIDGGSLGHNLRGFHTIEYFLFRDGQPRTTITERELEYLLVVTELLRNDCLKLWSSWAGKEVLAGRDAEALEEAEYEPDSPSYAYQFKNAGKPGSVYISPSDAIDAIIEGCQTIADEVGSAKIGGPNELAKAGETGKAVMEVESWYSWNSITDYTNNIESIRNSYLGGREGKRGNSLSAFVQSKNPELDIEILNAINDAYTKVSGMQKPFRNNLTGQGVDDAIESCANLSTVIGKIQNLKN